MTTPAIRKDGGTAGKRPPKHIGWAVAGIPVAAAVGSTALVLTSTPNAGFSDAAAVLVFAGMAAVAIERVVEGYWAIAEKYAGKFWPFSDAVDRLRELTDAIDRTIKPLIDTAAASVDEADKNAAAAKEVLKNMRAAWEEQFSDFRGHLPDNRRVEQLATLAFQATNVAQQLANNVERPAAIAQQTIAGTVDFLATFKDNPGKRAVSAIAGVSLGLLTAGATGLDLVTAALAEPAATPTGSVLGVLISGIVIGLGAGPTHTVISTLQEVRNARRAQTQAVPTASAAEVPASAQATLVLRGATVTRGLPSAATQSEPSSVARFDLQYMMDPEGQREGPTPVAKIAERSTSEDDGDRTYVVESARPRVVRPGTLMLRR